MGSRGMAIAPTPTMPHTTTVTVQDLATRYLTLDFATFGYARIAMLAAFGPKDEALAAPELFELRCAIQDAAKAVEASL